MLTIPAFIARTLQDWFGLTPLPQEAEQQQQQQQYSQQQQQRQQQQQQRQQQQPQLQQQRQNAPPSPRPQQKPQVQGKAGSTTTGLVPSSTAGQKPAQAGIPEVFQSKTVSAQHSAPAPRQVRNSPSPQTAKETEKALPADPARHTSSRTLILTPSVSESRMSVEWAQQQVEKFKFDFDQADKDKSGTLSFEEVYDVLQRVGFKGSQEEAKFIFGHLDRDRNQRVTREEFTATLNNLPRLTIKEFVLRKAFLKLDKDGSGYLTRSEIIDATKSEAGLDIAADKISDLLIYLARDDQDGKVSYEEFLHVFGVEETATVLRQIFSKLDTDKSGFLSKEEILEAVKADHELKLKAEKISDLLIHWVKDLDKKISYEEFVQVWLQEKAKKPK